MKNDPTAATGEAMPAAAPDYEKAFDALEGPIALLAGRAKAIDWMVGHMMDRELDQYGCRSFATGHIEALYYLVSDMREAAKDLDEQWQELA